MTERLEQAPVLASGDPPSAELVQRVRSALEHGRLCALPTETVYGLGARADLPAALEALRAAKGRPTDLPLTWHVASRTALDSFVPLRALVARLARRYWPGPLTLVLHGVPRGLEAVARDGWTGVRWPAHATTTALLAACDFPVVLSSANRHGEKPALDASETSERFGSQLALVVDGGPARLGEASGVLAVGPGRFELLREGLLRLEDLRRTAGLRIAFVCTGNTCRSPMAETLARQLIAEALGLEESPAADGIARFGFEVGSMGLHATSGGPPSEGAVEVLGTRGLELRAHRSRPAVPEVLQRFDRVFAMTRGHLEAISAKLPPGRRPQLELLDPRGRDIADPMGGDRAAYEQAAHEIEQALTERLPDWV